MDSLRLVSAAPRNLNWATSRLSFLTSRNRGNILSERGTSVVQYIEMRRRYTSFPCPPPLPTQHSLHRTNKLSNPTTKTRRLRRRGERESRREGETMGKTEAPTLAAAAAAAAKPASQETPSY
ncbi:hypothetical protein E2C01_025635 [Portunus trituberculatus]|uniref:Uncharacterized protein n=1 Tax=Portunus trituberculatus TaxID=210409 RepID=A0A5B7EG10_PORTR|nr:hypothetical protein [Portunus trituberculatus]